MREEESQPTGTGKIVKRPSTTTSTYKRKSTQSVYNKKPLGLKKEEPKAREKKPAIPKFGRPKANSTVKPKAEVGARSVKTPQISKTKSLNVEKKSSTIGTSASSTKTREQKTAQTKVIKEVKTEMEEEKYEEAPNKIDPKDFEVFSDESFDEEKDIDRPKNTKSLTYTMEVVKKEDGKRVMVIRKKYYLEDGRELRVKNIKPVKSKS